MTDKTILAFQRFHAANPEVFKLFEKMARKIRRTGPDRYGAWAIFNVIRWERDLTTTGGDFKISNNYIALYSRMLIRKDARFKTFFRIRPLK